MSFICDPPAVLILRCDGHDLVALFTDLHSYFPVRGLNRPDLTAERFIPDHLSGRKIRPLSPEDYGLSAEARMVDILVRAVHRKSNFDYKGGAASRSDAEKWIYDARKFLVMAGKYV
jgi:hypothetical protein